MSRSGTPYVASPAVHASLLDRQRLEAELTTLREAVAGLPALQKQLADMTTEAAAANQDAVKWKTMAEEWKARAVNAEGKLASIFLTVSAHDAADREQLKALDTARSAARLAAGRTE